MAFVSQIGSGSGSGFRFTFGSGSGSGSGSDFRRFPLSSRLSEGGGRRVSHSIDIVQKER
ncbi:hypothetical protein TSUD_19930 [Trifolium subterraneum]|uniref:Uncharacterized protein n=1 Tax=Trifolium subterraneum TaxID=3900 RepID=A0A2Z6MPJ4_TRISU|nr:hypothetical protein TSUD_19930 [Trifolium subterraneum]